MFQRVSFGFLAGLLGGVVIVGGLVLTGTRLQTHKAVAGGDQPSAQSARLLVEDWQRMRSGTWTVDSTFVRLAADGRTFRGDIHEAQRPPERVRTAFGTTTLEQPGKTTVCAPSLDQTKGSCRTSATTVTFEEGVQADVKNVQTLVGGPTAAYSVRQTSRHCYEMQATGTAVSSTWGRMATFCFDGNSGAIQSSEIHHGDATDTVTVTSIRSQVEDSEFARPAI